MHQNKAHPSLLINNLIDMAKRTMTIKFNKNSVAAIALSSCMLAVGLSSTHAHAGAWVAEKGRGYTKVGVSDYKATDFFGDQPDFGEFEGTSVSFYGEYGLGNKWGIYTSALYQDIKQTTARGETSSNSGLGDLDIGLKYQWQADPFVLSTSFAVKLPNLYDEDDALPLGNGQEDYEFRVLLGKSLNRFGYLGLELGYRFRTDEPSDEIRYLIEYGVNLTDNLYFRTKLDGIESANNADSFETLSGNLSRTPEFNIGKLEITAGWNFGQSNYESGGWGAEITYTDDLYGDETLQGDGIQFGITRVF